MKYTSNSQDHGEEVTVSVPQEKIWIKSMFTKFLKKLIDKKIYLLRFGIPSVDDKLKNYWNWNDKKTENNKMSQKEKKFW